MIQKRFKQIMTVINLLFIIPVGWVIIGEIMQPGPLKIGRIVTTAVLAAVPLGGTIAITITGSAVLKKD